MSTDDYNLRHKRIAQSAYYKAANEGFPPDRAIEHWLEAEREIDDDEVDVPESLAEG